MSESEAARLDMIEAFARYKRAETGKRDHQWEDYVEAREKFLKLSQGTKYKILRITSEYL